MTLHKTRNMVSDTDFQFIMGTILGQAGLTTIQGTQDG
jgi:hypothetical protein